MYLSGLILIVGAVVASLYEKRHRPRKSRLRSLWSRMGSLRRHRIRFEAEAAEHAAAQERAATQDQGQPDAGSTAPDLPSDPPSVSASRAAASGDGAQADAAAPSP